MNENPEEEEEESIEVGDQRTEGDYRTPEPTREEVEEIISKLKNNKSPGANGITAENIKYAGEELKQPLFELILTIWRDEEIPEDWRNATIIPILKKGDKTDCSHYRGVSLQDVAYKILATLLKVRLDAILDPQIHR